MKKIIIVVFIVCVSNAFGFQDADSITYNISAVIKDSVPMLKIQATFSANNTGVSKFYYPNSRWGEENLQNCLINLAAIGNNKALQITRENDTIIITHSKKLKSITMDYLLKQDKGTGYDFDYSYRPVIQESYFHVFSANLFVRPTLEKSTTIKIFWKDLSESYKVFNSFGSNQKTQIIKNSSLDDFGAGVFVGGDYKIHQLSARNKNVSLATLGQWNFLDEKTIVNILNETVNGLDKFWEEKSNDFFAVVLSTVKVNYIGNVSIAGGTGLHQSFDAYCTDNSYTSMDSLVSLFNHELNHQWIGLKITNENEEEQYWFSEGFTTYYTAKLVAKNAINQMDSSFFIKEMNRIIEEHYASKAKNIPNSAITTETFWGNPDYEKIPYNRGALFAFYLDQKIQKESNSKLGLDDVMREILREATASGQKLTHPYFIKTVNRFLNEDIQSDFKRYIEDGDLLPLERFFKEYQLEFMVTFSKLKPMGLSYDDGQDGRISTVVENSDAEHAGFMVGDIITAFEENPKPGQKATYTVKRGEKLMEISLIRKERLIDIPQLKDNDHKMQILQF